MGPSHIESAHERLRVAGWVCLSDESPLGTDRVNLAVKAGDVEAFCHRLERCPVGSRESFVLVRPPQARHWDVGVVQLGPLRSFRKADLLVTASVSDTVSVEVAGDDLEIGVPDCLRDMVVEMVRVTSSLDVSPYDNAEPAVLAIDSEVFEGYLSVWTWRSGTLVMGPEL